jgi:GT2 family glycosyltransferase
MSTCTAVIPTVAGREELLARLLASLPAHIQRIVVDKDDIPLAAKRNFGGTYAKGKYIIFIDDDNYLKPGCVEELMKHMNDDIGIMGITACYDNDPERIADGGSKRNYATGFMTGMYTNTDIKDLPSEPYEVDEVANAFMIRRQLFRNMGGFDQLNFPIDLDEADLCRRVKAMGKKVMMCPTAQCCHKSITYSWIPDFRRPMNAYFMGRNKILYAKKHKDVMALVLSPVMVLVYCAALLYRKKPWMVIHFLKGTYDGIFNRSKNQYF